MRSTLLIFTLLPLMSQPAATQAKPKAEVVAVEPRDWEHDKSDLSPDPKFNFGSLKNGMRYAWAEAKNPPKQILLRLHVDIGSLVESDTELGMAHFVEHMAFNGTAKFKAGALVETFQKQGIKFGQDINAHTGFDETVYELDLPDGDPARLKVAMQWMRDIACGLKMDEKEVTAEKGVIDSEQRTRDNEGFRHFVDEMNKLGDGLLHVKRLPIGVQAVRAKFNSKACLGFYKRWYRPENMTFLLVGDLAGIDAAKVIEEHMGTVPPAKGEAPDRPDLGEPTFKQKGFAIERGGPFGIVNIAKLRKSKPKKDDAAGAAAAVPAQIALLLLEARLEERREKEKLPYQGVNVAMHDFEERMTGPRLLVRCEAGKWRDALTAVEREVRRVLEQGVTDDEVKKAWTAFQRQLVPDMGRANSYAYVGELLLACARRYVPMEDRARKEAIKPGTKGLTADGLVKVLRDEWEQGTLVLWTDFGIDLGADPQAELMEVWDAAKKSDLATPMAVTASAEPEKPKEGDAQGGPNGGEPSKEGESAKKVDPRSFAYAQPDVVRDATATAQRWDDLRAVSIALKNGVKVLYRKSDGEFRGFSRWQVRVGEGEAALGPGKHAVAYAAARVFLRCGLGKNDWETVQAAGGGADFDVEADALVFSGTTLFGADPKREFEAICAYLTDPAFAQGPWDEWKKKLDEEFKEEKEGKPSTGSLMRKFHDDVRSPEPRLRRPTKEEVAAVTLDEVKAFLKSQIDGPIAITASGVDGGKFEKAIYSTFSKLPARRTGTVSDAQRTIVPLKSGINSRNFVESGEKVALLHILYPCPDAIDAAMARKLSLLEDIVGDRLRVEIREKKGGAYSPNGGVWGSTEWRGLGWVSLDVQVDPTKVDEMVKACTAAMEALGTKGATQAELDRLRTAHLGDAEAQLKGYDLWFDALRAAHKTPAVIDEMRAFKESYQKITLAEMNLLAKQVFAKGKENVFVASPK